ncbi:MAG: hypothetical protein KatS3mg002_0259 [Candidatus Woesearchaeota archaeon]|nr:MAG: hypothetical protein KatS3mg002_0259 [Candidatus Woesearchaeota archaeon]
MGKQLEKYLTEYLLCKENFEYFCSNYIKIELPGGDVLFKPYKVQVDLINTILDKHHVIVLKSRQIGISTITKALCAWLTVFYENVVIGIISKDAKEATDFARDIRGMIEKLPSWMKPSGGVSGKGFAKKTEQSFILTNGSKVFASPVNPNAPEKTLRGKAITFLVIDEAAFIKYLDTAWTAIVPALATSQKNARQQGIPYGTVILSTPNKTEGVGKWFYERYMAALTEDDIFVPFRIHWKDIPELANDPEWYENQKRLFQNNKDKIDQELELKFLPGGGSFFDTEVCKILQSNYRNPIIKTKIKNGELWIFEKPDKDTFYLIGIDTASAHGSDNSAITVWNYETVQQVADFECKSEVFEFVEVIRYVNSIFPNNMLIIESNSYGNQIIETLGRDINYNYNIFKEERNGNLYPGVSTNNKTRPLMIEALHSYISESPEIVSSERLALQLVGLELKKNGRVEASSGLKDDLALTAAFVFYVRKYCGNTMSLYIKNNKDVISEVSNIISKNTEIINPLDIESLIKNQSKFTNQSKQIHDNGMDLFYIFDSN